MTCQVHYLLIATIVACPFLCRSRVCSSAGECCALENGSQTCCDGHSHNGHSHSENGHDEKSHDGHSDHHPSSPSGNFPCGYCQCICGGAVIEHNDDDATQQMDYPLHDVVVTSDSIADVPLRQKRRTALGHDGRICPGRFLCLLHMSFLC